MNKEIEEMLERAIDERVNSRLNRLKEILQEAIEQLDMAEINHENTKERKEKQTKNRLKKVYYTRKKKTDTDTIDRKELVKNIVNIAFKNNTNYRKAYTTIIGEDKNIPGYLYYHLKKAARKDLQVVQMRLVVNYHLEQGKAPEIFTNIGTGYVDKVIVPTVHEAAKATTAQFTAIELITDREQVRYRIEELLKEKMIPYNIIVEQVSITDFNFGEQFNIAIENKVTAEQNALTEQNKLKVIEFQAQQKIAEAEGTRNSTIAQAQGQAEATRLNAEAEAYRVQLVQEQLSRSPQYTEYIKATRWTGTLPQFYMTGSNNPLIMTLPNMTG